MASFSVLLLRYITLPDISSLPLFPLPRLLLPSQAAMIMASSSTHQPDITTGRVEGRVDGQEGQGGQERQDDVFESNDVNKPISCHRGVFPIEWASDMARSGK